MESISELRRICQADKLQRSRGLTRLNRFISIYATLAALALGVSANALTVASIGVGLAGAALLALPDYLGNLGGVLLLYMSFLLDQVDGEVARYHRCTITGSYLDEIRHILIYAAPVFAFSTQLLLRRPTLLMASAGFAAAISLVILRFNPNARYLLYTKKAMSSPPGAYTAPTQHRLRVPRDSTTNNISSAHKLQRSAGLAIDGIAYLTTNQVSLLFLMLAYVHVLTFVADRRLHEAVFLIYAGTLVLLAVLGVWKMAYRGRIETGYAEIHRSLSERGVLMERPTETRSIVPAVADRTLR